jgi:hypothetical protein
MAKNGHLWILIVANFTHVYFFCILVILNLKLYEPATLPF